MMTMKVPISMTVNGKRVSAEIPARTLLVTFIRDHLRLTGTHIGCDTAQCGACSIHLNGIVVKSCSMMAVQADGAAVVTIEAIAEDDGLLHPMQEAFANCHALQCGFCTPGMVMTALDIVREDANPSRETIAKGLEGNLCRCTGYRNIVDAIVEGARLMRQGR
jgi:carbon-monoxide dehydrogenase small subunit